MDEDYSRHALLGAGGRQGAPEETDYTRQMDDRQLLSYQERTIEEQDKGLETIYTSLKRQRVVATKIGDEVDDQNEMLEDLGDGMEHVNRRIDRETRHTMHVMEKAKAGGMCCTVFLLFVAIIVLAAVPA